MSDIADSLHDADCTCMECSLTEPHFLAQRLTELFGEVKKKPSLNEEIVIMLIGDPSIEGGTDSIFIGGIQDGLPQGSGALLTIVKKAENYDGGRNTDDYFEKAGNGFRTSLMLEWYLAAGVELHDSEFPFVTLSGLWSEGKLLDGDSYQFDIENNSPVMIYSGTWKNDTPHGSGNIFYPGAIYSGSIEFGQKHGFGVETADDGRVIEGEWHRGLYHGFMKFKNPDGYMFEQEYHDGEEIGPRVQSFYEDEEKIHSTLIADIEDLAIAFSKSWDERKPVQSYSPGFGLEDITSLRPVSIEGIPPSKIPELDSIDVGETLPEIATHTSEKLWIMDQSDYVIKDASNEILGWVKREAIPNQDSSLTKTFIVFPDLSYFQGVVGEDLLPNGQGTYTFPGNFSKISGNWSSGQISNGGVYVSNRILFYGDFSEGQPSIDGEYYIQRNTGSVKKIQTAKTSKEKEILREQLIDRIGSDVWSREKNFVGWNSKFLEALSSIANCAEFGDKKSELSQLIESDESQTLEFKSSVWATYNNATGEQIIDAKKNLNTEDSIVKTIAGFCNADGGTLIIGVQDRPEKRVVGVDADFPHSGKQKDIESFQNSLFEVIRKATGQDGLIGTNVVINMEDYEGHRICIISVKKTQPDNWVWVSLKKHNKGASRRFFFVRTGPQTTEMSAESAHNYRMQKEALKS